MTEKEFNRCLGAASSTLGKEFVEIIDKIFRLLDEADHEDFFGTEGWRHSIGWDL